MIRHRLTELSSAAARAIELLRAAGHIESGVRAVLELLGQAACSDRATYWTVDPDLPRLRAVATWTAVDCGKAERAGEPLRRTASLSQGNASHVWRRTYQIFCV